MKLKDKCYLILDMELWDLEFALLGLGLALFQYFVTMLPFPFFGIILHFLCHRMVEVCNLSFDFDFS